MQMGKHQTSGKSSHYNIEVLIFAFDTVQIHMVGKMNIIKKIASWFYLSCACP